MESMTAKGRVEAFLVAEDGSRRQVVRGSNTLLYWCADAVARLFAGIPAYSAKYVAFVYASGNGQGNSFHFTANDRTPKTQSDIVGSGLSVHDISLEGSARFTSSDPGTTAAPKYAGNVVTFKAMTENNSAAEYIYGFILKDGPGADANVLAVKKLDSPVQRTANYAMAVSWAVTFS